MIAWKAHHDNKYIILLITCLISEWIMTILTHWCRVSPNLFQLLIPFDCALLGSIDPIWLHLLGSRDASAHFERFHFEIVNTSSYFMLFIITQHNVNTLPSGILARYVTKSCGDTVFIHARNIGPFWLTCLPFQSRRMLRNEAGDLYFGKQFSPWTVIFFLLKSDLNWSLLLIRKYLD